MSVLQTRTWVRARRIILLGLVLFFAARNYGPRLLERFEPPGPETQITITHSEFRAELEGDPRPVWFIGLANNSPDTTYDNIVLEATYTNGDTVVERDRIIVTRRLAPGQEDMIGSRDARTREGATNGTLRVVDAEVVQ